jgi:hypothetical protein
MADENESLPAVHAHRYLSYLIRLWQETPGSPWRASMQDITTDERHGFASLESLFTFLRSQIEQAAQESKGESHDHLWT